MLTARDLDNALQALSRAQRLAFLLLVVEHAAAGLEPRDNERGGRLSKWLAADYLKLPRLDAMLTRWWSILTGTSSDPSPAEPSASSTHMFPEGSLQRRFSEHLDASAPGDDYWNHD